MALDLTKEQENYISRNIEDVAFDEAGPVTGLVRTAENLGLHQFNEVNLRDHFGQRFSYHVQSLARRHPVIASNGSYSGRVKTIASVKSCSEGMQMMFKEKNKERAYEKFI